MHEEIRRNFILQQGFKEPAPAICPLQYSALLFQPRIVLFWVLAGILFQSAAVFYALSAALWWSALVPKLNGSNLSRSRAGADPWRLLPRLVRSLDAANREFVLSRRPKKSKPNLTSDPALE
jgi:hypothetical protein